MSLGHYGLASLRVFRVFRYLSYFKFFGSRFEEFEFPSYKRGFSLPKTAQLCAFYMEQLYQEFATEKSMGSLLIIVIIMFTSYAAAAVFTVQKPFLSGDKCDNVSDCMVLMIRLVLYDSNGFEYLQALMDEGDSGLIFFLFVVTLFNGIVLVNGLIGIFAQTFTTSDEKVEESFKRIEGMEDRLDDLSMILEDLRKKDHSIRRNSFVFGRQSVISLPRKQQQQQPPPLQHQQSPNMPLPASALASPDSLAETRDSQHPL
jgi:hypothetical protein